MKMELKLKKRHPRQAFKLGRHTITPSFQSFDLDEKELKELEGAGPQCWVMKKEKAKAKKIKED